MKSCNSLKERVIIELGPLACNVETHSGAFTGLWFSPISNRSSNIGCQSTSTALSRCYSGSCLALLCPFLLQPTLALPHVRLIQSVSTFLKEQKLINQIF
ncbi:hypothetical protein V1477_011550 [Vespula maculifrons]|uniref:Uncharacterized protein n=1 Tax=Vespula maculifrons TaxID=7453 RepID=A0ABD2BZH6_VESMC